MSDKVIGGTPIGSRSLCATCRNAHVVRGLNFQNEIYCRGHSPALRMLYPIEECSIYDNKHAPSLYDMEQIAWRVTSRKRGPVGFEGTGSEEVHIEPPETIKPPTERPVTSS